MSILKLLLTPVDDLRWKAPQRVQLWSGVKVWDKFKPSPIQAKPAAFSMLSEEFLVPEEPIIEDCLNLMFGQEKI